MPKMFAPEGVASFSHGGHEFQVAEDGSVEVAEHVVDHLIPHGFVAGETPPAAAEKVSVSRETLIGVLDDLGVAVNPAMRSDKLIAALVSAAKAAKKPAKGPDTGKGADGAAGK